MNNLRDLYSSKFLKAGDLPDDHVDVTIVKVTIEEVGRDREVKGVVQLRELEKRLILNKTNYSSIATICGRDETAWTGQRIGLVKREVSFEGEDHTVIRVMRAKAAVRVA